MTITKGFSELFRVGLVLVLLAWPKWLQCSEVLKGTKRDELDNIYSLIADCYIHL